MISLRLARLLQSLLQLDRLLSVATQQSADVERACKVNKLLHSKARNRLTNTNVARIMRCYINGKLVRKLRQLHNKESSANIDLEETNNNAEAFDGLLNEAILEICENENEEEDNNE